MLGTRPALWFLVVFLAPEPVERLWVSRVSPAGCREGWLRLTPGPPEGALACRKMGLVRSRALRRSRRRALTRRTRIGVPLPSLTIEPLCPSFSPLFPGHLPLFLSISSLFHHPATTPAVCSSAPGVPRYRRASSSLVPVCSGPGSPLWTPTSVRPFHSSSRMFTWYTQGLWSVDRAPRKAKWHEVRRLASQSDIGLACRRFGWFSYFVDALVDAAVPRCSGRRSCLVAALVDVAVSSPLRLTQLSRRRSAQARLADLTRSCVVDAPVDAAVSSTFRSTQLSRRRCGRHSCLVHAPVGAVLIFSLPASACWPCPFSTGLSRV